MFFFFATVLYRKKDIFLVCVTYCWMRPFQNEINIEGKVFCLIHISSEGTDIRSLMKLKNRIRGWTKLWGTPLLNIFKDGRWTATPVSMEQLEMKSEKIETERVKFINQKPYWDKIKRTEVFINIPF